MTTSFMCKAPWTSIAFQPTGVAPCCVYKLEYVEQFTSDGTLFADIQQTFLNGQIPDGCQSCTKSVESNNDSSAYYHAFDKYHTDFQSLDVQEINLRSNNFCNLACRSCGPHFSSKWEEDFHGTVIVSKDRNVFDKIKTLDLTQLKMVVCAGGEPTITPEHTQLLQMLLQMNHTTPAIRIATNLQVLNYKGTDLVELWKQFPNLYLNVSVDAVDTRAENIRSGTKWSSMLDNIQTIHRNNIAFNFLLTVSALNIWFLEETLDFLKNNFPETNVIFNILHAPDILNICVIPDKYRTELNKILDRCLHKGYPVSSISRYLEHSDTSHLWDSFLTYNLLLDVKREESFCKSLPMFDQIFLDKTKL